MSVHVGLHFGCLYSFFYNWSEICILTLSQTPSSFGRDSPAEQRSFRDRQKYFEIDVKQQTPDKPKPRISLVGEDDLKKMKEEEGLCLFSCRMLMLSYTVTRVHCWIMLNSLSMTFLSKANWTEFTRVYAGWRWGGGGGRSGEAGGTYEGSRKGYPWWCGVQGGELGRPQFPISEAVCHTTQPLWQLRVSYTFAQLFAFLRFIILIAKCTLDI